MMRLLLLGLLIHIWPSHCFKIKSVVTTTADLFLGKYGELIDTSGIPDCGSKKIILKSYAYNQMECTRLSCQSIYTKALSEVTAFQLHRNCSFRQKCENLEFPMPTNLWNNVNANDSALRDAVTIQYQCLGEEMIVLNMCKEHNITFSDTLYLIINDYTENLKECQCWVNMGAFSLSLMDVRLNMRNKKQCSDSELIINSIHKRCDPQSDSYGAIFGEIKMFNGLNPNAMVSLKLNSHIITPEMVWIALIPEGTSRLYCRSISLISTKIVPIPTRQTVMKNQQSAATSNNSRPNSTIKGDLDRTTSMISTDFFSTPTNQTVPISPKPVTTSDTWVTRIDTSPMNELLIVLLVLSGITGGLIVPISFLMFRKCMKISRKCMKKSRMGLSGICVEKS